MNPHNSSVSDVALLEAFVRDRSESAFAELVRRHVDLVYSACARQLRDPHDAQDACQAVFIVLAARAGTIRQPEVLGAWLMQVATFAAKDLRERQAAASARERRAARWRSEIVMPAEVRETLPVLDDALAGLSRRDREILVLRYFQDRSPGEAAGALGISENAVALRTSRALRRLRRALRRQGVTIEQQLLPPLLLAHGVQAAPATAVAASTGNTGLPIREASRVKQIANGTLHRIRMKAVIPVLQGGGIAALFLFAAMVLTSHSWAENTQAAKTLEQATVTSPGTLEVPETQPTGAVLIKLALMVNGQVVSRPFVQDAVGQEATVTTGAEGEQYTVTLEPGEKVGEFWPVNINASSTMKARPWSFSTSGYFREGEAETFTFSAGEGGVEQTIAVTVRNAKP